MPRNEYDTPGMSWTEPWASGLSANQALSDHQGKETTKCPTLTSFPQKSFVRYQNTPPQIMPLWHDFFFLAIPVADGGFQAKEWTHATVARIESSHCSDNTGLLNPCTTRELQHNYFELKTLQKQQVQEVLSDSFFLKAGDKNPHKKGTLLVPGRAECSKSPETHQRKNLRDEPYKNNSHLPLASPCIYIPQSTASKSLNSFPLSCHFSKNVLSLC